MQPLDFILSGESPSIRSITRTDSLSAIKFVYFFSCKLKENIVGQGFHGWNTVLFSVDANTVKGTERSNSAHLQVSEKKIKRERDRQRFTGLTIVPSFYEQGLYSLCICNQLREMTTVDTILSSGNSLSASYCILAMCCPYYPSCEEASL